MRLLLLLLLLTMTILAWNLLKRKGRERKKKSEVQAKEDPGRIENTRNLESELVK
jgi:hypothetical protein